jgi:hypothetical protein
MTTRKATALAVSAACVILTAGTALAANLGVVGPLAPHTPAAAVIRTTPTTAPAPHHD